MNLWIGTAVIFVLGIVACGAIVCRGKMSDGLVALQAAGTLGTMALLCMAEAMGRPSFFDLAVALSLASIPGTMTYAYFAERWLR